jgi:hypothetical protein
MNALKTILRFVGNAIVFLVVFAAIGAVAYWNYYWGPASWGYPPAAIFGAIGFALAYVVDYMIREPFVLVLPALAVWLWYVLTHRG